jgi:mono/diheme cytochrome c family protein
MTLYLAKIRGAIYSRVMKLRLYFTWIFVIAVLAGAGILAAQNMPPNGLITSNPVYKPDFSRESQPLPTSVIAWDATMKTTNVPQGTLAARFVFYFTNVASQVQVMQVTNISKVSRIPTSGVTTKQATFLLPRTVSVTNVIWVTNSASLPVTIGTVHPSCGCTTAQLPPLPWTLLPGTNGQIGVTVNLAGKFGTIVKTVHVGTDRGSRDLIVQIGIVPLQDRPLTDAERARQMAIAKVDRQAVFRNDCATCHMNNGQYKYGKELYDADCGICHESEHRASMVPDLHSLKVATNEEFWRTWISHGKAGSFMPAFATSDGGPLNDNQIASLASYLNSAIPTRVPPSQ